MKLYPIVWRALTHLFFLRRYAFEPEVNQPPQRRPRRGDGKDFLFSADDVDDNLDEEHNGDYITVPSFDTPGCGDVLAPLADALDAPLIGAGSTSCDDKDALSGVPYNIFANEDTGGVYAKFCQQLDPKQTLALTVDAHGAQKEPIARRMKRTPPPNPDAYDSFSFNMKWQPDGDDSTCEQTPQGCTEAFFALSSSPCGHRGGEQNTMTAAGKYEIPNCGTYSYSITGPDVPPPSEPSEPSSETPALGSQHCALAPSIYDENQPSTQSDLAGDACKDAEGHLVKANDPDTSIHFEWKPPPESGDISSYVYDVYWEEGCKSDVTEMDAGNPLEGQTCKGLLTNNFKNCEFIE